MPRAFADNINSFNNVSNNFIFTASDDESRNLAWLSPLEPQVRHQDICDQRVERVGDWLLKTKEFRSWYGSSGKNEPGHAALLCYGDPGVGKSYITSVVIDYLCGRAVEKDMAVACFYYDFASREEQSTVNMLGSLLKQLLSGLEAVPVEITRNFQRQRKMIGGRGLQLPDIANMFLIISSLRRIFICVDALDECAAKYRLEVLYALGQILQRSPNIRLLMTGRPHIQGVVDRELGWRAANVTIKPRDDDMVTYLRERLRRDTTPEAMDSELEGDILKSIHEEISESFLLASLKVEAILRETTIHRRRKRLNATRDALGLGDAYAATLERIRAQDAEKAKLAITTLMWICHSERPLEVDELCHAIAVEIGSTCFNTDNVPAAETLLACCQGLVTVDKEASTVRLVHHTLGEYLSTQGNLFPQAHSAIAETCLTYLNSDQAKAISAKPQPGVSSMPFLRYCSRYWGTHANRELSGRAKFLAMELLDRHENHIAAKSLLEQILDPDDLPEANAPSFFSGLHCASFFGIVDIMTPLLGMNGCDTNQRDSAGMTPLTWAVWNGHEEAMELLLEQGTIDPNMPDDEGRSPLSWAAFEGRESLVKQLLGLEDVSPDKPDDKGRTPLSWAAIGGHESVVRQLLGREDVDPDRPDNKGYTPLSHAAVNGHEPVVRQLLDREGVSPDKPDNEDKTPLSWAAMKGHGSVVKQLLDRGDVNPDKPDDEGWTPLFWAAFEGRGSVVKLLLDREDVNPGRLDSNGRTPLSLAAFEGHESVVKQLLGLGDASPCIPDHGGRTPLSWAAFKGHESVVKRLLGRENVDPDRPDNSGRTPLSLAAFEGHGSVVKQLLGREDVSPDRPDNEGNAPLSWAAIKGHASVVKQLLDREDVNPDKPGYNRMTALSWAAVGGHGSVVKQLLDRGDVNPDRLDNEGKTPLSWAAFTGHGSVVKRLLDREDVSPGKPDYKGRTPLLWAASKGHLSVVEQLLDWEDANPDRPNHGGNAPASWTAIRGYEPVLSLSTGGTSTPECGTTGMSPHFLGLRLNSMSQWSSEFWTRKMPTPTN